MNVINTDKKTWILHNAKFDIQFLFAKGIDILANIQDTMLMESVVWQGESMNRLKLSQMAKNYCDIDLDKTEQTSDWDAVLSEKQIEYAFNDVIVLETVYEAVKEAVLEGGYLEVAKIENDAVKATARLEYTGVCIDCDVVRANKKLVTDKIKSLSLPFIEADVNINSPRQLKGYLNRCGIPVNKTNKKELAKYSDNNIVMDITAIRQFQSLQKGFDTILEGKDRRSGRVYCKYKQNNTSTGRYSTKDPNLQGLPHANEVRSMIIAPTGKKLVICDYSQVELRIMAEVANDPVMMQAYIDGKDLHRITAATVNNISYDDVTPEQRKAAKAMNFGLIYGMSGKTFIQYAKTNYGVDINPDEAIDIIDAFFGLYREVCNRIYAMEDKEDNFEMTRSGRKHIWREKFPNMNVRCNYAIQGLGADIIKIALARVEKELVCTGEAELMISVHDEIVIAVDSDKADEVAVKLKNIMEEAAKVYIHKVPIIAEVSIGDNWAAK